MLDWDIGTTGGADRLDCLDVFLLHSIQRKELTGPGLSRQTQGPSLTGVRQNSVQFSGKALRIVWRNQFAGIA
jgi:hypothetical protein